MPQPWLKGVKKRSVEEDYRYYDTPRQIWEKIHGPTWEYSYNQNFYQIRDRSFMALMYLSTCRVSELCRAALKAGFKPSITSDQFHVEGQFLKFRDAIILKRREMVDGEWTYIQKIENYPLRNEIPLPLSGGLSRFTGLIMNYLTALGEGEELFKFQRGRAHQIVKHTTGEMNHYFRDMGLKLYARLLDRNLKDLKDFSGHQRVENLMKYLGEGQLEKKVLEYRDE